MGKASYQLSRQEMIWGMGEAVWPATKEGTALAFLEALGLGLFDEARGYLSKAGFTGDTVEDLGKTLAGGGQRLVGSGEIITPVPADRVAIGVLRPSRETIIWKGKSFFFNWCGKNPARDPGR